MKKGQAKNNIVEFRARNISLPADLWDWIEKRANQDERKVSSWLRRLLSECRDKDPQG